MLRIISTGSSFNIATTFIDNTCKGLYLWILKSMIKLIKNKIDGVTEKLFIPKVPAEKNTKI